MIGHEFDIGFNVDKVQGQAYLVSEDARIVNLREGMQIAPNQVVLTNVNSSVVVSNNEQRFVFDGKCASCLTPMSDAEFVLYSAGHGVTFNPDAFNDSDVPFDLDVAQLQQLILDGVDPTEVFEAPAAGEGAGSANAGFIVVDYGYAETLAEAGFDTTGPLDSRDNEQDLLGADGAADVVEDETPTVTPPDIDAVGGQRAALSVTEGDWDILPYGTPDTTNFVIEAGTEALIPGSLQIAPSDLAIVDAELAQITANGDAVVFTRQTNVDASGVGTFTLTGTVNGDVVVELVITATQNGNDLNVSATLVQHAPLDHTSGAGTYVSVDGERITINLPLQVADTGGDLMQNPAQLTLESNDGAAPAIADANVELTEVAASLVGNTATSTEGGDLGSDSIASVNFDASAAEAQFVGITSHGQPTTVDTSVPGVITLYTDNGDTPEKILEISLKPSDTPGEPAEYSVTQYQPFDQHGDSDGDNDDDSTTFTFPFTVTDADGDVSNESEVSFKLIDGEVAEGGKRTDEGGFALDVVALFEQGTPTDQSTPSSVSETFTIEATTDRLNPVTLSIEEMDVLQTELLELQNNAGEHVDDVTLTQTTDSEGNPMFTITASINGETALELSMSAKQGANGLDVDLESTLTQYQPLIHPQDPSAENMSGRVTADGSQIVIEVPVQVEDTDGDRLVDPDDPTTESARVITFAVLDDDSTLFGIDASDTVRVDESGIDDGTGAHPGSQASGTLNFDNAGDDDSALTLNPDKAFGDSVSGFGLRTDTPILVKNSVGEMVPLTAVADPGDGEHQVGTPVMLVEDDAGSNTYPKTYFGQADDGSGNTRNVFQIQLYEDGTFDFELLSALVHEQGDGANELAFTLSGYAVDADGDESPRINVPIVVTDDVPHTQGTLNMTLDDAPSGEITATVDVFALTDPASVPGIENLSGADAMTFITAIFNGSEWVDVSTTRPTDIDIFSVGDASMKLGTVAIDPRNEPVGEITFTMQPNLENPEEVLQQGLQYRVTDFDGDTAEGEITLTITDQIPTLSFTDVTGNEDQGQADTNTESAGVDGSAGIPINMQLNLGDNDLGEAFEDGGRLVLNGEVTLATRDEAGDIGGTFYFNGAEILPDADGNIVLNADMFDAVSTDEPLIFDLTGVTFVPDPDYSSFDGTDLIQFDVELDVNGHAPVMAVDTLDITVEGVADVPNLSLIGEAADGVFEVDEDHVRFGADDFVLADLISAELQDSDGSETLRYEFTLSPDRGELLGGFISGGNGSYVLSDPSQLDKVRFVPDPDFSGDVTLTVKAISTESAPASVEEASAETAFIFRVEPQADDARLTVQWVFGNEDAGNPEPDLAEGDAISLAGKISLTTLSSDNDGSESLFVRLFDLPDGAVLQLNEGGVLTPLTDTDRISVDDIDKLEIIPPVHSNENFTVQVEGIVVDTAPGSPVDERIIPATSLAVIVAGVADAPAFEVENPGTEPGQWLVDDATGKVSTTVPEDGVGGDGLVAVDFTVISGEKAQAPDDTSESLSMIIVNPPQGVGFVVKHADGSLTEVEQAFAGWETDDNGMSVPAYSVDLAVLAGQDVYIKLPTHTTEDLHIVTRLIATENDGDTKAIDTVVEVIIDSPVIDADDRYTNPEITGFEDRWITVDWQPDLTIVGAPDFDAPGVVENVVGATISGFADTDAVQLVKGSDVISLIPVGGEITLTDTQIADGYQLQVKREEHSDADLTLTTSVTVRQEDFEGASQAEKVVEGTININIEARVETEAGELQLLQGGTPVTEISTDSQGRIVIQEGVNFAHPDDSSDEVVIRIVITDLEDGFYVDNAESDGKGGWVLNDPNDFTIMAPPQSSGQTTFTISAMVQDEGDAGEGDSSALAPVSSAVITLNYENTTSSPHEAYQVEPPAETVVIEGFEDNEISLAAVGEALVFPSGGSGASPFDQVTVVINGSDIPAGTVIGGARYHIDNDTYIYEIPGRRDNGNPYPDGLDLSGLTVTPPDDYAGELTIPVTVVNIDSRSGDTKTTTFPVQLNVKPLVDLPPPDGAEQPSDNSGELAFVLAVNGTTGLNDKISPQPLEPGETEGAYPGQALEDGLISLSLRATLADTDGANGEEAISGAVLTVPASAGVFVLSDGSEVSTITLTGAELGDIKFRPAEDFSGTVEFDAQISVTDTATTGTDQRDISTTLFFDVTAVNDEMTFTQNGSELAEDAVAEIRGDEDSSGGISLAELGASFNDINGSEHLVSVLIQNLPEGFTLAAPAVNAGAGSWVIPADAIADLASLSAITVQPPLDFSGTVAFNVTVFTQEGSLSQPHGFSQSVSVTVDPVGDGANVFVAGSAATTEDTAVTLDVEIRAKDDRDAVQESPGVNENAPETLLITIAGVPEGGQIVLPDGVTGTVTPETADGGNVVVEVADTQLDGLTFVPPQEGNGVFTLDLVIQTVDNGAVSDDVVNKQITVNVSAVNDAPVNILADSYDAEEDTVLTITDLLVEDVDAREGTGIVNVQLSVGAGSTLALSGENTEIDISGEGTNLLRLEGSIDAINALLQEGVEYQFAGENTSGEDSLTMTARDRSNAGAGGQKFDRDTVAIVVAPKSDTPALTAASQLASVRAATGALVPLLGLMATLVDPIDNEFSLTFSGLGIAAELVDASGTPVGTNNGDGSWMLSQTELESLTLSDLNLRFSAQLPSDIAVTALSDVGDGNPKEATLTINVNVVDTETTGVLNDADNSADNLVVDGNASAQVHGGAGEDVVVGGLGEDILVGGAGDDDIWGGEVGGTGDGDADTFKWVSGDFGDAANVETDTIKDFEAGIDVIDISDAFDANGMITFTDLANRLDIQTVESNTRIQVLDDTSAPIQNIIVEGVTLNELLGMDATGLTQDEILESMMMSGQLVVFDLTTTQFGTEADDTLTAGDDGERIYAGDGDDTVTGGLGDDILVGGAGDDLLTGGTGDDTFAWSGSDVEAGTVAVDTITDFDVGNETTGDKLDISALLPDTVDSNTSVDVLLGYITPETTDDGLTLHISQTPGSMKVQDVVLGGMGLTDLGLTDSATPSQILTELVQLQTLKLD